MQTLRSRAGNTGILRRSAAGVAAAAIAVMLAAAGASAFPQFSATSGSSTYCRSCHGDFRAASYTSPRDGMNWGNLHNLHRQTMLSGDCETCHVSSGRFPVTLNLSAGGVGLSPIACMGCHGRAQDNVPANPEVAAGGSGYGAGLRQHHHVSGITLCASCHQDADPANYTPVQENVLPPYYGLGGTAHPAMPTQSCNGNGSENFAGAPEGLDNDGDDQYDGMDVACMPTGVPEAIATAGSPGLTVFQNVPNPFTAGTRIDYELTRASRVEIRILDVSGRAVREIAAGTRGAGRWHAEWDGLDRDGRRLPGGIYFCEVRSGEGTARMRMVLLH